MLEELKRFNSYGRLNDFILILGELITDKPKKIGNITKYCLGTQEYYNTPVTAIIWLLSDIKLIAIEKDEVKITPEGIKIQKLFNVNKQLGYNSLTEILINNYFFKMIDPDAVKFDLHEEKYYISNNDIECKFSGIRNLFINFNLLKYRNGYINLFIDNQYQNLIESLIKESRKLLSYEEFLKIQKQKELAGIEAEEFVLKYERNRLKELKLKGFSKIKRISETDVNAGYDILSFENEKSRGYDRLIEVKSFSRGVNFYWSKNEIETAKQNKSNYYLYLIDRSKMEDGNYKPLIIKNPYDKVINNKEWIQEAQSWRFSLKEKKC
jgi:hypothetical protein